MATIENGSGVYATLGYNFSDPNHNVLPLSEATLNHMNVVPALVTTWQAQDIANNDIGGYYQNPVANTTQLINDTANSIVFYSTGVISADSVANAIFQQLAASTLPAEAQQYILHTNRLSGVSSYATDIQSGLDTSNKPYLTTAMSLGKSALYIVNQTDNIQNTSPIMGCFTSILVGPQLQDQSNVIFSYPGLIANSINIVLDGGGVATNVSNLTLAQVQAISNNVSNTVTLLNTRRVADETFYTNLQIFNTNFSQVSQFSNMGETQSYLVNNLIGTPKLLSRINS